MFLTFENRFAVRVGQQTSQLHVTSINGFYFRATEIIFINKKKKQLVWSHVSKFLKIFLFEQQFTISHVHV